ncbi:hypothetical protein Tco_0238182 [Tanacetum coccineum]
MTEILKKFDFTDVKTASTHMETQKPLLKDEDGEEVNVHLYRSMIGSLKYITSSRPDIMFAVCACARYQVNLEVSHLHVVKRIFRYLKCQPKLGLLYPKDSPFDLVGYTDSDYAGASLHRKSTIGGCQFLGCRLISWQCKKQTVVANSTTEAEYVAASNSNEKKLIQMIKIHTDKNVADLLTKAFDIVDFLNASSIRYALTVNPTLYTLCIEQFRATIKVKTVNGEQQLQALVDGKKIIITEATIRRDLQLEDADGVDCLPNAIFFKQLTLMGYEKLSQKLTLYKAFFSPQWKFLIHTILQCLSAKTTAWNEFSSTMASAIICLAISQKFNFSKYIFESMVKNLDNAVKFLMKQKSRRPNEKDTEIPQSSVFSDPTNVADEAVNEEPSMQLKELIDFCTKLQQRVLGLENTKTAQAHEITRGCIQTGEEIHDIDADEDITLENVHDAEMFDVNDLDGDEVVVESKVTDKAGEKRNIVEEAVVVTNAVTIPVSGATITNVELTLAQTLAELKSARPKTKRVVMQEPSEPTPTISLQLPSQVKGQGSKDKGKAKMIEPEKPLKKKEQIKFDEEEALRLQTKFNEEDRLAREKDQQVEEANIVWDDIQAKIDADYQLAEILQAQEQHELTIEEKSTLFVQLLEKRKKHFTAKRSKEKRNRPPIRAQQRNIMCTYLKNMAGWKPKDLKKKSFANIQELFNKAFKRVNTFVDFRT